MAYIKNTWVNNETEVNAQNMNHIEEGLENTQNVQLLAISDEEPAQCVTGDKYYNTDTKLIYTAIATNTWDTTGESPIPDIIYIVFSEKGTYSYNGDELVSVGGGSIAYIGTEEPPADNTSNLWINPDDVVLRQDNIVKTIYNESDDYTYSTNYINDLSSYSLEEQRIGTWIDRKPLYKRTFTKSISSSTLETIATISDIDYIKIIDSNTIIESGTQLYYVPFSSYETSSNFSKFYIQKSSTSNSASIQWTGNSITGSLEATVVYTKTTD